MGFLALTVDPMLVADEQAMQRDLFLPEEFDIVFPQYNRAALLRTDLLSRYRAYAIAMQWGLTTANRCLAKEDEKGLGPDGDIVLNPLNMVRLPIDPTAILDAGGNGDGQGAALEPAVRAFLERTLSGGRPAA